jgi:Bacteriophage T4 gp9/10-like protein.
MAQQTINLGTVANDGTGDTLRDAGGKINDNFTELYDLSAGASPVATVSAQDTDLDPAHNGHYVRFTYSGAKTLTVQDDATEPLPANGEWHIRNASASGNLTLVEDTSVTINPPVGGTLEIEPGGTVTLKRVGTDEFDLMGVTVAA